MVCSGLLSALSNSFVDQIMAPIPNQTLQSHRSRRSLNGSNSRKAFPPCVRSPIGLAVDVVVLIAVFLACGYLVLPYLQLLYHGVSVAVIAVKQDSDCTLIVLCFFWVGFLVLGIGVFAVVVVRYGAKGKKCGKPNCLGLRDSPKFDFQIETEDIIRSSSSSDARDDVRDDVLIELSGEHQREIEGQLKKVAPPNGRILLIFRARCGCSAGRMVVWGPKKNRKMKK